MLLAPKRVFAISSSGGYIIDAYDINMVVNEDTAVNIELLKKLKKKGIRLAIVSTSQKRFIDLLAKRFKLDNLFDVIISKESVKNLKPNSEAYSLALTKLNIKKENCIVVEDSYRGIMSAQNLGLDVVSVYKYSLKKQLYNGVINIKEFSKLAL